MPYRPHSFGLRFNIRLSDLTAADVLRVRCPSCSHVAAVAPHQLLARYPDFMKIVELEKRMRCMHCAHRGAMFWSIERAYPNISSLR